MNNIIEIKCFKKPEKVEPMPITRDDTLERLVKMIYQTNLVALDKTSAAIRRSETSGFAPAAARVGSISERIHRACHEVGLTLPPNQRIR